MPHQSASQEVYMSTANDLRIPATLPYFREHRQQLGPITYAAAYLPHPDDNRHYVLVLRDSQCGQMQLSGVMPIGETSRVDLMQILVEAGFAHEAARTVLTHSVLRLRRAPSGTTWLEAATGLVTARKIASDA
jgi:hypothetical protein